MITRLVIIAALLAGVVSPLARAVTAADRSSAESTTDTAADSVRAVISDQAWGPSLADECNCCSQRCGWFAGADYRLVRTHFSEAVAFATLTTTITPGGPDLRVAASELNFNFQSAFAVYAGYHINDFADVRFSYWHLDTSVGVSATPAANQVIVDPFGNLAVPGTNIDTRASVKLNVYDLEYMRRMEDPSWPTSMTYSAGLRFANVNQFYDANISGGGALLSDGVFRVNWFGVGPYGSLTGRLWAGEARRLSAYAKAGAALLVGKNDITTELVTSGNSPGVPGGIPFTAGQSSSRILVVPVLEAELGASWQANDRFRLSAGWFVQAWLDLGVSGGTFSGQRLSALGFPPIQNVFGGADDTSIMSFEGFFVRGEFNY
jgi:hypothetical protein